MKVVEDIQLTVPEIKGFEYTGEYRSVKRDEYYANNHYEARCNDDGASFVIGLQLILKKVYEEPKPEPTLLERIEAAYEGKEVVLLEWSNHHYLTKESLTFSLQDVIHIEHIAAQSIKGFAGYVYENELMISKEPTDFYCAGEADKITFPCAVLFEK